MILSGIVHCVLMVSAYAFLCYGFLRIKLQKNYTWIGKIMPNYVKLLNESRMMMMMMMMQNSLWGPKESGKSLQTLKPASNWKKTSNLCISLYFLLCFLLSFFFKCMFSYFFIFWWLMSLIGILSWHQSGTWDHWAPWDIHPGQRCIMAKKKTAEIPMKFRTANSKCSRPFRNGWNGWDVLVFLSDRGIHDLSVIMTINSGFSH